MYIYIYIYIYTEWDYQNQLNLLVLFYHTAKYHVIHQVVLNYLGKITVAILISIHTKTLSVIAAKNT